MAAQAGGFANPEQKLPADSRITNPVADALQVDASVSQAQPVWSKTSTERLFPCFSLKLGAHESSEFSIQPLIFGRNRPDAGQDILIQQPMTYELRPATLAIPVCPYFVAVHRRQTEIIEFQNDRLTALTRTLGKKRLLLTDDQRR